jgi:LysM repeat protein
MRPVDNTDASAAVAPPPPPPPPRHDQVHVVQRGENVSTIAAHHGTSVDAIKRINPQIRDLDVIHPGERINLPQAAAAQTQAAKTDAPAVDARSPQAQATDKALAGYTNALKAKQQAQKDAPGNGAVRADLRSGDYDRSISDARQTLYTAVRNEIAPQVDAVPAQARIAPDTLINSYGNAILQRHAGQADAQDVLKGAVGDYQLQRKADSIAATDVYGSTVTPKDRLDALGAALKGQPAPIVDRVLANPHVQSMLGDATKTIAAPYSGVGDKDVANAAVQATEASKRLADITANLPPDLATQVVQQSMPTIGKIAQAEAQQVRTTPFENISKAVGAMGAGAQAKALTSQIAQAYRPQLERWQGFFEDPNGGIVEQSVGDGASANLSVELARQLSAAGKQDDAGAIVNSTLRGVQNFGSNTLKNDIGAYTDQTAELARDVAVNGASMTPEQLNQALDSYTQSKGAQWQQKTDALEEKVAQDGLKLLDQINSLRSLPPDLAAKSNSDDAIKSMLGDKNADYAISLALKKHPEYVDSASGKNLMQTLAYGTKLGDQGNKFAKEMANAYVRNNVLPAAQNFDPRNPASLAEANAAIDKLKNPTVAKLLGVDVDGSKFGNYEKVVDNLKKALPSAGDTVDDVVAKLKLHAQTLDHIGDKLTTDDYKPAFDKSMPAGQLMRMLGLSFAGVGFLNSTNKAINDPSLKNDLKAMVDGAALGQKGSELMVGLGRIDSTSLFGKFGSTAAGRAFGFLSAGFDAWSAGESFASGDWGKGTLYGVGATGGTLAAVSGTEFAASLGIGAWAGPVGIGLVAVSTAGLMIVDGKRDADKQAQASSQFLQGAGIDAATAQTLGRGGSETSMLQHDLGLDPQQIQQLARNHPDVFGAPGYAQSFIDVASANGIKGADVNPFLDAVAHDNPNYMQSFFAQLGEKDPLHASSHAQGLVGLIQNQFPSAAKFVQQHSPQLFGADASARQHADNDYENKDASNPWVAVANLVKGNSDPVYQAEIVQRLKNDGTLDIWVDSVCRNFAYNGWPQAAQAAIQSAHNAGVITDAQAQTYLGQIAAVK